MDKLSETLNQLTAQTTAFRGESRQQPQDSTPPLQDMQTMTWLWGVMGSMYGHKWASSYGTEIDENKVWAASLRGLSRDQIKHGLNACVTRNFEWPPSAPEFRALCVDEADREWRIHQARAAETDRMLNDNRLRLTDQGAKDRAKAARDAAKAQFDGMFKGTAAGMVDEVKNEN